MANIAKLNVRLTGDASHFSAVMSGAGRNVSAISRSLTSSVSNIKLAGRDTLDAFRTTLAVARSELRKLGRNRDVQVALEIGREHLSESWIRARSILQSLAARSGLTVALGVVADRRNTAMAWLNRQRNALVKPINATLYVVRDRFDSALISARNRLEGLRRYRAVRILLAASNGIGNTASAALRMLGPLRRLAFVGLTIPIKLAALGIAAGVAKARAALGGLASFGRGVVRSLTSGFALVGVGIAALGGFTFARLVKSSMDSIDATGKLANRLGITTEKMIGLQHAADLSGTADSLTGGLEKMLNAISDAASKGGAAGDAFRTLGLDAKALSNIAPDQAFGQIADALIGIENPSQRAALAMDVFGKSGQRLLPLLMSGSEGIAAAQAEAEKLGLTFSQTDFSKVERANDALTRLSKLFTGAFQSLAIEVSPFIEAVAVKLTDAGTSGEGMGAKVVGAFEWVIKAVAKAADWFSLLKAGFKELQAGAALLGAGIAWAMDKVVKGITATFNGIVSAINMVIEKSNDLLGTDFSTIEFKLSGTDMFEAQRAGLMEEAKKLHGEAAAAFNDFNTGASSRKVTKLFADIRKNAADIAARPIMPPVDTDALERAEKVLETITNLQKDVSQFGLSDSAKQLMDLEADGATADQLTQARALLDVQEQLNRLTNIDTGDPLTDFAAKAEQLQKLYAAGKVTADQFAALKDTAKQTLNDKLSADAKSLTESVQTPLEQYQTEIERMNELLERGLITQETFDRAQLKAKEGLSGTHDSAGPAAIQAGSAAAQRLAFDLSRGQQRLSRDDIPKKALAEAEETNRLLDRIERNSRTSTADTQTVEL